MKIINKFPFGEELANFISHAAGGVLSVAALVILIIRAVSLGNTLDIVSFTIFGTALVLMYTTSSIFHALKWNKAKEIFEISLRTCRRAGSTAEEKALHSFGNGACRLACGAVIRTDDGENLLLIVKTLRLGFCDIGFALMIGGNDDKLISAENALLIREGKSFNVVLIIDDLNDSFDCSLTVLPGYGSRPR